jgi:aldehyde dehydrogenase (NAD+)
MAELEQRGDRTPIRSAWEYATAPESREIVKLQERYGLFVGGEFVEPRSGEFYETLDPSSEEPLAEIPQAGPEDVALAVGAAHDAFENGWSAASPAERAKYLFRIARILQERSREFAVLESLNGGKPIRESRDVDLPLAAAHFFYYAGWADKLEYAFPHRRPQPLGVAGQIIPWNFPLLMLAWKIAPALAGGNTVVLKPAETTPLSALLFCDVLRQAELPPGVVNIVTGDGATGAAIVKSDVDKIAFTGSTEVGKAIQRELAGTGTRLTLELGGKAANIIFDDAALDQAVEGIINGIYFNQGHVCCAGSRLLVQESIYEPLIDKLKRRLTTLRVGDPLDKNTDVGAINSRQQLDKIEALVVAGQEEGAEIYQPPCRLPEKGYWFAPTVFTNVAQSYRIAQEEIFGPVLSVLTFRTPDEAVEKANNTPYGLSAGVWTEKGSRILWMAERLEAGVIWANTYNRFDPASPFGGYKESGFGREGGLHGLEPYLDFREKSTEVTGG